MSMIFTEQKMIFVHIPKCAGTSIKRWSAGIPSQRRLPKHQKYSAIVSQLRGESYEVFAIMRDPVDRAQSLFKFCGQLGHGLITLGGSRPSVYDRWRHYHDLGIESFLTAILQQDPDIDCWPTDPNWHIWDEQCSWLDGAENPTILKYSTLQQDFHVIQQKLHRDAQLPIENASLPETRLHNITPTAKKLIQQIWPRDTERYESL